MQHLNGQTIRLWEGKAPHAIGDEELDIPTLTLHVPPAGTATGAAIVICPGGGYTNLAPHEGPVIGDWLAGMGVVGAVLKYRLAPRYKHPAMLTDAKRALRTVRARAGEWQIDPNRIGILGFSAGGHLTATASTLYDAGDPAAADPVERVSSRPDLSVLLYAVITMIDPTHSGSRRNLLGESVPPELQQQMSAERNVTTDTPPAFMFHTVEDSAVAIEHSLQYAAALRKAGIPFELHAYERGRHGVGLALDNPILRTWGPLLRNWLTLREFARAEPDGQAARPM